MTYRSQLVRIVDLKKRLGIAGFGLLERILDPISDMKSVEELLMSYKRAIGERLGIPPEFVSDELALKWLKHYAKAFVTPEKWPEFEEKIIKPLEEYIEKKHEKMFGTTIHGEKIPAAVAGT